MKHNPSPCSPINPSRGFSLLELLAVIAVLGIVAAIAIPRVTNTMSAAQITKLESDVATVNQALKVYLANGGILTDATEFGVLGDPIEQKVIDKLKTRRNRFSAASYSGLKTEMIDRRLAVRMQTTGEAASGARRAVWNPDEHRFVITTAGPGVKEFFLNDQLASLDYGIDEGRRSSAVNVNAEDGWIWAYDANHTSSTAPPGPTIIPMGGTSSLGGSSGGEDDGGAGSSGAGGSAGDPEPEPVHLGRPRITPRGGSYPASEFPLTITISNPNGPDTWIMVSVNGGDYTRFYDPFTIESNTQVRAYAEGPSDLYLPSSYDSQYYTTALRRPSIRPGGGTYPATRYPLTVEIRNYNREGTWVMYSINGGAFTNYVAPFPVEVDTTVEAYVEGPSSEYTRSSSDRDTFLGRAVNLKRPNLYVTAPAFTESVSTILVTLQSHAGNSGATSELLYALVPKDAPPPPLSSFVYYLSPVAATYSSFPTGFTAYGYEKSLDDKKWNDSSLNDISTSIDFFGIGVGKSTLFILDFSGSMDQSLSGGSQTRLQVLKSELQKALSTDDMGPDEEFGVMIFSSEPWWATAGGLVQITSASQTLQMVPATTENKTAINSVVAATGDKRYTNFSLALSAVDQISPPPEQIIFLTDGSPTIGDGTTPDINNEWIQGLNEIVGLGIPVHTVGIDLQKNSQLDRLEYMAEQTGGTISVIGSGALEPDSWEP